MSDFSSRYTRLTDLYHTNQNLIDSTTYNTIRQHNLTSNLSTQNQPNTFLDNNAVSQYLKYSGHETNNLEKNADNYLTSTISQGMNLGSQPSLNKLTDNRHFNNPVKYNLNSTDLRTQNALDSLHFDSEFNFNPSKAAFSNNLLSKSLTYNFKDLKSINQSVNASDRTVRLTNDVNPSGLNLNTAGTNTNIASNILTNSTNSLGNKLLEANTSSLKK